MVEDPVVVIVPSHSSTSRAWEASALLVSLVQVAPPPETDDTERVPEEILMPSTQASPAVAGLTDRVDSPLPLLLTKEPTEEMLAYVKWSKLVVAEVWVAVPGWVVVEIRSP